MAAPPELSSISQSSSEGKNIVAPNPVHGDHGKVATAEGISFVSDNLFNSVGASSSCVITPDLCDTRTSINTSSTAGQQPHHLAEILDVAHAENNNLRTQEGRACAHILIGQVADRLTWYTIQYTGISFLISNGYSKAQSASLYSAMNVLATMGNPVGGYLSDVCLGKFKVILRRRNDQRCWCSL